jgi:hypothetical protein
MPLLLLVLVLLTLAACTGTDSGEEASVPAPGPNGWRLASGKPPTDSEFAAVFASCQEMTKNGPMDQCLSDLGLRRAP